MSVGLVDIKYDTSCKVAKDFRGQNIFLLLAPPLYGARAGAGQRGLHDVGHLPLRGVGRRTHVPDRLHGGRHGRRR